MDVVVHLGSTQPQLKLWRCLQVWLEILEPPKRSSQLIGGFGPARLTTRDPGCGGRPMHAVRQGGRLQGMRKDEQGWESAREPWGKVVQHHERGGLVWLLCKGLHGFLKVLVIENGGLLLKNHLPLLSSDSTGRGSARQCSLVTPGAGWTSL